MEFSVRISKYKPIACLKGVFDFLKVEAPMVIPIVVYQGHVLNQYATEGIKVKCVEFGMFNVLKGVFTVVRADFRVFCKVIDPFYEDHSSDRVLMERVVYELDLRWLTNE